MQHSTSAITKPWPTLASSLLPSLSPCHAVLKQILEIILSLVFITEIKGVSSIKHDNRGAWAAWLVKHLGSGHSLRVVRWSPTSGSKLSWESVVDSLPFHPPLMNPPLTCVPVLKHTLSLALSLK